MRASPSGIWARTMTSLPERHGGLVEPVKIALACFSFKVLGGRERDCLAVARGLGELGHSVTILTTLAPPEVADAPYDIVEIASKGVSNHGRLASFAAALAAWRERNPVDAIIGFDRMPGLDYYYAAAQPWPLRSWWQKMLPRYRQLARFERSVFGPQADTYIFYLADRQITDYGIIHATPADRYEVLPPTLHPDRRAPPVFYADRDTVRAELGLPADRMLLVSVAAFGRQKGVDRTLRAMTEVPQAALLSVGMEDPARYAGLAESLGLSERTKFVGYRTDVDRLIGAADLMVHPARVEATGTVIVESLLYGVPVITSGICGYASHVAESGAGRVLAESFEQEALVETLRECLEPDMLERLRANARDYSKTLAASPGMTGVTKAIAETVQRRSGSGA